jgi:hypothetical protein
MEYEEKAEVKEEKIYSVATRLFLIPITIN